MPSQMSTFRIDMLTRRVNTRLRNEIIAGNIDINLLRQELLNLRINYNQSSLNTISLNNHQYPPRQHTMWDIFNNLTAEQLYIIDNLLSE